MSEPELKPDFSGEWILNRETSTLSPGAAGIRSGVWQIEHREPTFRHKAAFETANDPIQWQYEILTDGSEIAGSQEGVTTTSSLRWDGDALVATWRINRAGSEMNISFRYDLIDGGRCLRAAERLRGTDHDQDNVWMFDRLGS